MEDQQRDSQEKIVYTACSAHCGGTCLLKVYIKDGLVTRIETDDGEEPQLRACLRHRAYRQLLYHPDRILYPLRRVGERGEGKFERISWDEALDTVASNIKRVRDTYGPGAIVLGTSSGDSGVLQMASLAGRMLALAGGYTGMWGIHSYEGGIYASLASYADINSGNTRDDLPNSKLIILWALDPVSSIHQTGTIWYLTKAKEAGARIISVDPRFTRTTMAIVDQWIPIRPSTDTAMLVAMAYVMIKENLQDQKFIDKYTVGFEQFKSYVMGDEDGIPKTPSWAEAITGVSATTIEGLAREYATTKPAALLDGIAAVRTAYGEQFHRAAIVLAAMTGNIGIHGGNAPGRSWCGRN